MSRSPTDRVEAGQATDYRQAWQTVTHWMEQGLSWSGRERNCAFLNLHDGTFADASYVTGLDWLDDGRALAMVDWDQDGDLDMWLVNRTSPMVRFMRNDSEQHHHYLQFFLQGTQGNRDAIGARVEIHWADGSRPLIETLRGGEGFLSQPSKWIHFGLGQRTDVSHVRIRWPNGQWQQLQVPRVDARYILTEGVEQLLPRGVRPAPTAIEPGEPRTPAPTELTAHLLSAPYPLQELTYTDFSQQRQTIKRQPGGTVLVNLWASWCIPCVKELHEFQAARETLQNAQVEIIPLALDGVGKDETDLEAAPRLLEKMRFGGRAGRASTELLSYFQSVNDDLLGYKRALPVPSSFLLDDQGRLIALYKGPVSVDRVLADAAQQGKTYAELRQQVMPLSDGVWLDPPESIRATVYADLALRAKEAGDQGQAIRWFETAASELPNSPQAQADLANELLQLRRFDAALSACQRALSIDPQHVGALRSLANVHLSKGNLPAVIDALERILAVRPKDAPSLDQLGVLLIQRGDRERAGLLFEQAVQSDPSVARYHHNRARYLEDSGNWALAMQEYREANRIDPQANDTVQQLAWLLAVVPADDLRDPARALALAQQIVSENRVREARALDVLAACFAANGQFDQAIGIAQQAHKFATQKNNRKLAETIQSRLELYRQQQAFRLPAAP